MSEYLGRAYKLPSQSVLLYQQVSQFMGSLSWASGLIPLGPLHLRPLQQHFQSSVRPVSPCPPPPRFSSGRTYRFSLLETISGRFRRILRYLRTPLLRGGAPIYRIPRFRVPGPVQTANSISIVWSSRR